MMNNYNSLCQLFISQHKSSWLKKSALLLFFVMFSVLGVQSQNVTVAGALSGNGSYATLGAAFTAIGTSQAGANIAITVTGNTTETAIASLGAGTWATLTINPSGARTITGSLATELILFNGADNVTINGLNSGGNSLVISNTSTSATSGTSTIKFQADAVSNTITNCSILGSSTMPLGTNGGNINFSTATTTGNDNNTISNCLIGPAGANLPSKLIYSNGSTTNSTIANSNITITNCEMYDFFLAGGCAAVYALTGNTDWNITNNKIYQTAARSMTSTMNGIFFANSTFGNNMQITGNTIGYASNSNTGTLTLAGTGSFVGIQFTGQSTAANANNINSNIISDISFTSGTGTFSGITNGTSASSNTININSNTIRNITNIGSTGTMQAISAGNATTLNCNSNTINNITRNTGGTFYGILYSSPTTVTFNANTITNLSSTSTTSTSAFTGIYSGSSPPTEIWTNNVIDGMTSASTGAQTIYGIYNFTSTSGNKTCTGNTVKNLSLAATSTGTIMGIRVGYLGLTNNISGNNVNNISGGTNLYGLYVGTAAATSNTTNVFNNKIYGISSSVASPTVAGIFSSSSTTTNIYNNVVGGLSTTAASNTIGLAGVWINGGTTVNMYHNTVRLPNTSGGSLFGSAALLASTTPVIDLRNNILTNTSTATGGAVAAAYRRSSTTLTTYASTSNNNLFFGSAVYTDGTNTDVSLGDFQTRLADSRDSASKSQNPTFASTNGADANFLNFTSGVVNFAGGTGQDLSGINAAYGFDYNGATRQIPTDLGAFEFNQGTASPPSITSFTPTALCVTGGQSITITGTGFGLAGSVGFHSNSGPNSVFGNITSQSATSITVTTPAGLVDGYITVTSPLGSDNSVQSVTAQPTPTVGVSPNTAICTGQAGAVLTATGGATYSWSPATGLSATTGATVTATPTATTTYTVTGTSAAGCSAIATVTVTVNQTPTAVSVSKNPTSSCVGGITTLTATGGIIGGSATATIGTDNAGSKLTTTGVPYRTGTTVGWQMRNQYLFTATELNAAGITAGNFNSVAFIVNTGSTGVMSNNVFKMANVVNTSVTSTLLTPAFTTVLTLATYTPVVGTNSHTFTTPFGWDGTSNVLLEVCGQLTTSGSGCTMATFTTPVNTTVATGSTTGCADATGTVVTAARPVIAFGYTTSVPTTFAWTGAGLFSDSGATLPYAGQNLTVVYSKDNASQNYTATATSTTSTCSATSSVLNITPNALPTIVVPGATTCTGGAGAVLTASGAVTYVWSPATGLSATTGTSVTATPASTTVYTIIGTDANGCQNSTTATVTVNNQVVITAQPVNVITTPGNDATFTVAATGTGLTYQWEVNTGAGFTVISGATSTSYTESAVTLGMTNYAYRCVVSGTAPCAAVTSDAAILTVGNINVTAQPTNQTVCSNTNATFTITATGVTTYQWQFSTNGGTTWANATSTGNATDTLVLSGLNSSNTGTLYRCQLDGGVVNSDTGLLTVYDAIFIGTQPVSATVCSNAASVTFMSAASGSGVAYQWQFSTNGGSTFNNIGGATSQNYTITGPTVAMNGYQYRVNVSGTAPCAVTPSNVATLTVNQIVAITTQPSAVNYCTGPSADFTVVATGTGLTYQWEFSTNGGTSWNNYPSGATSATLAVTSPATYNGNLFRSIVTGTAPCTAVTSSSAALNSYPVMGGVMTVGAAGTFTTLASAVNAYNNSPCFTSNVEFSLTDANYNLGTAGLSINPNVNAGSYTLTIKPAVGVSPTITGAVDLVGIFAIKANNVTIDGSNTVGGTSRNLTITNTSVTGPRIVIIGSTTTTPITNVAVRNSIIINGFNGNNAISVTKSDLTAGYFNNITIQNNNIQKAFTGINVNAVVATGNGSGLLITGNDMTAAGDNSIRLRGISVTGVDGATVTNNNIANIVNANAESPIGIFFGAGTNNGTISGNSVTNCSLTNTGAFALTGISVQPGATAVLINVTNNTVSNLSNSGTALSFAGIATFSPNTNVTGNTVTNLSQNANATYWGIVLVGAANSSLNQNTVTGLVTSTTGTSGVHGINVQGASTNVIVSRNKVSNIKNMYPTFSYAAYGINIASTSTTSGIIVRNNMIWDIATYAGSSTLGNNALGLYLSTGSGYKIYNNTVRLATQLSSTGTINSAAFAIASAVSTVGGLDVRNNIFVNRQTTSATTCYAISSLATNNAIFSNINFNNYSVVGTNLGFITSARADLAAIQTGFGQNVNSTTISPNFVSASSVYLALGTNQALDNTGTAAILADVPNDIDGTLRPLGPFPDMGAHEFTTEFCSGTPTAGTVVASPIKLCTSGTATVSATNYTIGVGVTYEWFKSDASDFSTNVVSLGAASANYANLSTGTITATTYYRLTVICNAGAPVVSNIAVVTVNTPAVTTVSPNVTICAGQSTALTAAGSSTYVWSPATGLSATTGLTVTATPTATTIYTVTGTDANGCTSAATVTVSVNAYPSAVSVTQGAASVCVNGVMSLTANGGTVGSSASGKIGASTTTNTTSTPFKGFWGGNKTQALYTPAELTALGLSVGSSIASVGYVIQSGTPSLLNGFTVKAGLVSASTLGTAFISGATNAVFSNATYTPPTGLGNIDYTLSTPIVWNGTSSLLIETCFNNNDGGGASANSLSTESSTVASGLNLYLSQDNIADVCTNATAPTATTTRPNLRVSYSNTVPTTITWSPTADLYTNPGATTAYTGGNAAIVYTKPSTASQYSYTATASNGTCTTSSDPSVFNPNPLPVFTLTNATICNGGSTNLTIPEGGNTYSWSPATGLNTTSGSNVTASPTATQIYNVTGTNNTTGCQKVNSVTVTVNQPVVISSIAPTTSNVIPGANATFTVAASGTGLTYQWQADSGSGFANIANVAPYSNVTTTALTISNIQTDLSGYAYRCVVSGTFPCTSANSDSAFLFVDSTGITQNPVSKTVCTGNPVSFTTVATSENPEEEITYAWEYKLPAGAFTPITADGFNAATGLTFTGFDSGTLSMTGATVLTNNLMEFHAVVNGYIFSSDAVLTVKQAVAISAQPANQTVCASGGTANFSVTASGDDVTYQWEFSTNNGVTWSNVSGAQAVTNSISILNPAVSANGNLYRVIVSGNAACSSVTSTNGTLFINNPLITAQPVAVSKLRGSTASFSVTASAATSYQWQYSTNGTTGWTSVANATPAATTYVGATTTDLVVTTTEATPIGANNYYRCVVTNNGCIVNSNAAQFTITGYCTPVAATSDLSYFDDFSTTGGSTNISNTGSGFSTDGYGNFTNLNVTQVLGTSVSYSTTLAGTTVGVAIWVDWNQNGTFETSERVANTTGYVSAFAGSFAVPMTATVGTTRMRILLDFNTSNPANPCGPFGSGRGEVEDYTFIVQPQPACTSGVLLAGTASAANSFLCSGNTGTTLTLTGSVTGYTGITYQWEFSTNGGATWQNASGASATTTQLTTTSLAQDTSFRCTTFCSAGGSVTSNEVAVPVQNPLIATTTPAGRCGAGTVTLAATSTGATGINWYAGLNGGSQIGTGTSFTTPSIGATTTYYAEATTGTSGYVGRATHVAGTGTALTTYGQDFTINQSATLNTVDVISTTGTSITISLYNNTGTTQLFTTGPVAVVAGSTQVVALNWQMAPGIYRLVANGMTGSFIRENSNVTYPIALGALGQINGFVSTITGTVTTSSSYYFMYNWLMTTGCASTPRTAVVATVDPLPAATISYATPFCSTGTTASVSFSGTTGGTYTSTAGLDINPSTGAINITNSTPGSYTVTYTMATTTFCTTPQTATTSVTINQAPTSAYTYDFAAYCTNGGTVTPVITGTSGTFTATPAGLTINPATGVITLASSSANTYTVNNTVVVAGCPNSVTPQVVTVNTAVVITSQPVSVSKLPTENATFSVTASGTGLAYQWQFSTNGGTSWTNLANDATYAGVTTNSLAVTNVDETMDQYQYQVLVSGATACATVASAAATLTVNSAAIVTHPANFSTCSTGVTTATFSVTTSGTVTTSKWEYSTDGGTTWSNANGPNFTGSNTVNLTFNNVTLAENGWLFRIVLNNAVNSNAGLLTVNTAVAIGTQPVATTACSGGTANFTVAATGTGLSYQWQVSTNGGSTWTNAGTNSATLALTGITAGMNNNQYQVIVSGAAPCSSVTSSPVVLTVNTAVAITTQPASATFCANANATFTVVASGTSPTYAWEMSTNGGTTWTPTAGTSATLTLTAITTAMNTYRYRAIVSGAAPCTSVTSNAAVLTVNQPAAATFTPANASVCPNGIQLITAASTSFAQPGVIGTGSVSNTTNTPFKGFWGGNKVQYLYTAAELTALGYANGTIITTLGMDITSFTSPYTFNALTIGMKNTGSTVLTSTIETGLTTVRNAANYTLTGTSPFTVTLPLDTQFVWNGTSNLLIEFCFNNNNGGGASGNSANVKSTTTTGNNYATYFSADSNATVCSAPGTATASTLRANMRFGVQSGTITWSPITGLFTNAAATTAYTALANASTVYVKTTSTTTYTATVTNSTGCSNTSNTTVTVLPSPTMTGITQAAVTCTGGPTQFNLTGLIPGSTSTVFYNINGGSTVNITGVVANGSGNGTMSVSLSGFNNGQTLTVTSVQRTDNAPSCSATISSGNTVVISVQPLVTYYQDFDGDTYGNIAVSQTSCTGAPVGYVTNNTDCNDNNAAVYRNGTFYTDNDGDGYTVGSSFVICYGATVPAGLSATTLGEDCNDANPSVYRNGTFYTDADQDGYTVGASFVLCYGANPPAGLSATTLGEDCDDTNPAKYRTGMFFTDVDQDGYTVGAAFQVCYGATVPTGLSTTSLGPDCNDNNNTLHTEYPFFIDADGDGFGSKVEQHVCAVNATTPPANYSLNNTDCNDTNASIWQDVALFIDNDGDGWDAGMANVCYGSTIPPGYSASTSGTDCNDNIYSLTNTCATSSVVNLTMFIEGYYTGSGTMAPVKFNQDYVSPTTEVEDLIVELHDATTFALVVSTTATLNTDGTMTCTFGTAPSGSFYIAVKGSNIVQTWSATPQTVGGTPLSYDFSSSALQAYGDNMIEVETGVWAFYSGDINQDEVIDGSDSTDLINDIENSNFGVLATDLNGDGVVDGSDSTYLINNTENSIFSYHP